VAKAGRKVQFEPVDFVATICARIASGESLRRVCETSGFPSVGVFLEWCATDAHIAEQYARARDTQADHYADDLIEIADTEEDPQRAKVRIDARKWVASKLKPKRYGDKLDLAVSGELKTVPDDQLDERLTKLLAKNAG
jgi:hypothetical protein